MSLAASHLAHSHHATLELAQQAVAEVLTQIGQPISALLLFLSEEFNSLLEPVLQQAMRQTCCLNIHGCISPGLLTEKKWVMDSPAVAALAIASNPTLEPSGTEGFEFLLAPAIRSISLLWLQQTQYKGPGTLVGRPINSSQMQSTIWHGGRIQRADQLPQSIHLTNFSMQYYVSIQQSAAPTSLTDDLQRLRQKCAQAPAFGLLFPGGAEGLLDEYGLDTMLTELRAQYPDTPWIGVFNPASPGHLVPSGRPAIPTDAHHLSHTICSDSSILIVAHHV